MSSVYRDAGRTSDAVTLLKKGLDQNPEFPDLLHIALGKAYLKVPDVEKAMAEFKDGLGEDAEVNELNDVAYALAEAKVHLSEAQDYSARAVSALSEKSMDISPQDAQPSDFSLMLQLAAKLGHSWLDQIPRRRLPRRGEISPVGLGTSEGRSYRGTPRGNLRETR